MQKFHENIVFRYFFIEVAFIFTAGCFPPTINTTPPTNIAATNAVRKKIGIRQIHKNWKFSIREFDCEKWKAANNLVKIVQRSGPEEHSPLVWEQDYYYGTGWLHDPDGIKMPEQVIVTYDYNQARFFVSYVGENKQAMDIIYDIVYEPMPGDVVSESGQACATDAETLKVADKLLKIIGKNRLNFKPQKNGNNSPNA